jgi:linoleoyl-CoA desaturase
MSKSNVSNASFPPIRYERTEDLFFKTLCKRVDDYFKSNNLSRFANASMVGKTIFQSSLLIGLFALIMSNQFQGFALISLQIAFYFTIFLVSVGIAHDGSHNAYSSKRSINRGMEMVFDFIGINSYMWNFNHIKSHHNAPNIPRYDSAIDSYKFFRFHPMAERADFHKYQHIYIAGIYALATLFKIFLLDFISFNRKRIGFIQIKNHAPKKVLWLIFTKLVVISYSLILPILLLDAPAWQIVLGFVLGNVVAGLSLGIIFQVTHVSDHTSWPVPDEQGRIHNTFARHILATTSDFCTNSWLITWISGGLNHHVAHHLFPGISQIHLPALTKIVQETSAEFAIDYKEYESMYAALKSHYYTLKKLGSLELRPVFNQ